MKVGDAGFDGFGEAYFSSVNKDQIKGWKKHRKMTLNLLVPLGEIQFVVHNGKDFFSDRLSQSNHQRLTIKPNLWLAFKGLSDANMLLNLASHCHEPSESDNVSLDKFRCEWEEL